MDGYREVVGTNSVNVLGKIIQNSYHGYRKVLTLTLSMCQVRASKIVTTVTKWLSALTLSMYQVKIVHNSNHGYRKVVGLKAVNVSGKTMQYSYHGYKKVVGTN